MADDMKIQYVRGFGEILFDVVEQEAAINAETEETK